MVSKNNKKSKNYDKEVNNIVKKYNINMADNYENIHP